MVDFPYCWLSKSSEYFNSVFLFFQPYVERGMTHVKPGITGRDEINGTDIDTGFTAAIYLSGVQSGFRRWP